MRVFWISEFSPLSVSVSLKEHFNFFVHLSCNVEIQLLCRCSIPLCVREHPRGAKTMGFGACVPR